jgi:hypothetical protein
MWQYQFSVYSLLISPDFTPDIRSDLDPFARGTRNPTRIVALSKTPAELTLFSLSGSVSHSDENMWPETHLDLETEVADGRTEIR